MPFCRGGAGLPKYYDLASRRLEAGDAVKASWPGSYGGKSGYLVLSKMKILFLEERGIIRTTVQVLWEKPYREITEVETDRRGRMELTDNNGEKHTFTTSPDLAAIVDTTLEDLMKDAKGEAVPTIA
jgi:hypothetical protein